MHRPCPAALYVYPHDDALEQAERRAVQQRLQTRVQQTAEQALAQEAYANTLQSLVQLTRAGLLRAPSRPVEGDDATMTEAPARAEGADATVAEAAGKEGAADAPQGNTLQIMGFKSYAEAFSEAWTSMNATKQNRAKRLMNSQAKGQDLAKGSLFKDFIVRNNLTWPPVAAPMAPGGSETAAPPSEQSTQQVTETAAPFKQQSAGQTSESIVEDNGENRIFAQAATEPFVVDGELRDAPPSPSLASEPGEANEAETEPEQTEPVGTAAMNPQVQAAVQKLHLREQGPEHAKQADH